MAANKLNEMIQIAFDDTLLMVRSKSDLVWKTQKGRGIFLKVFDRVEQALSKQPKELRFTPLDKMRGAAMEEYIPNVVACDMTKEFIFLIRAKEWIARKKIGWRGGHKTKCDEIVQFTKKLHSEVQNEL